MIKIKKSQEMKFELSLPYSLNNKVCVLENLGKTVKFGLVDDKNQNLKNQLRKNVKRFYHLDEKEILDACRFEKIGAEKLKKEISFSYGGSFSSENLSENAAEKFEKSKDENNSAKNAAAFLLNSLLEQACSVGATDIHIEENLVRFRVNGFLEKICPLSPEKGRELSRHIKVLSKLDLIETRRAQDGQFIYNRSCGAVFVRVSCVPALSKFYLENNNCAENIALRLLDVQRQPLSIEKLGFLENQSADLRRFLKRKSGLILICGATGSGKSTTAASLICEIAKNCGGKKIISVEDPPEYALENVTQIKVDESLGMSFSSALRFVFRQDPDVIFVGEIRDEISAKTVIQASLTGHLVIATVHSSGILEAVLRLKTLSKSSSELKAALCAVIFQELSFNKGVPKLVAKIFEFSAQNNEILIDSKTEKKGDFYEFFE